MLIEEFQSAGGLDLHEATDRAWESLLPPEEVRARENRRAFAHLLGPGGDIQVTGPAPVQRSVRKKVGEKS